MTHEAGAPPIATRSWYSRQRTTRPSRILTAAEEVFAERGASASTEEVAARAGVAIGALAAAWPDDLRHRTLALVLDALRPRESGPWATN